MFRLALAGGNITGSTVLSLMRGEPDVKIVGLYEKNAEAPAALLAEKLGIPVFGDIGALAAMEPEIVLNVTGDRNLSEKIRAACSRAEVIDAAGARLLLKRIEKQKKTMIELLRMIEDEKRIIAVAEEKTPGPREFSEFLRFALDRTLEATDFPAGSIAKAGDGEMELLAAKGLSKRFTENVRWKIMPGGLTDTVLRKREPVAIGDLSLVDYTNNAVLVDEGIRAVVASPLLSGNSVFGIIYLDDFKPREFPERQRRTLNLMSRVLGLVLDSRYTLKKTRDQEAEIRGIIERFDRRVAERTEELERINRDLQQSSLLKNKFITNMSHELRTPLNSIIGFSDLLLDRTGGDLTEHQERYVRNVRSSGKHLLDLVNTCLDIAKIEAGRYDMAYETFPVKELLTEVFATMKPLADRKSIDLRRSLSDALETVTADRIKVKQVLYNLLSNAVKFTPDGGKVGVVVEGENGGPESERCIKFSVWDSGVGIRPEDRERIFEEFEQGESGLSRNYEGAGLGLALTKKLVQLHGGEILLESTVGRGSIFTFTLPQPSQTPHAPFEEAEPFDLGVVGKSEEKSPLILVVEDDAPSAELLTLHLSQAGYKVAHAFDGEEALEKALTLRPFAILLDIMLPRKDGWEVLQTLKENDATSHIPVLIHSIIDNKDLAFALGATDYLLKPLDKDALLGRLQSLSISRSKRSPLNVLVIEAGGTLDSLKEDESTPQLLIHAAKEGRRGMELAAALIPDVILLDFELPDMLGFDVVKGLKDNPSTRNIPIFILTEKDIPVEERMQLVGKIERIIRKHRFDVDELLDHITEIEVLHPRKAGLIDDATGLFSHRYFQIRLAQEVDRAVRYKRPMNLMILDIDSFGTYVGEQGEQEGTEVVRRLGELLRKNIRGSDIVVRFGGDSFAVILPDTVLTAALSLANKFNAIIRNYPFAHGEKQPRGKMTMSVGLTFLDGHTPEELILCCEKALTHAIQKGGDRVEIFSQQTDETGDIT